MKNGKLLNCGYDVFNRSNGYKFKKVSEVVDLPAKVIDIAASNENSLLLLANGILMSRGRNLDGQLGLGDRQAHEKFEIVQGVPKNISRIFIKEGTSVIQLSDGTLMGAGFYKTLGFSMSTVKYQNIPGIPKNIKDFDRLISTMIILLTDDKIIEIGEKIVFAM